MMMIRRPDTVRIEIWVTPEEAAQLEEMAREGGFKYRAELVRKIVQDVLADDAAAHNEEPTEESGDKPAEPEKGDDKPADSEEQSKPS